MATDSAAIDTTRGYSKLEGELHGVKLRNLLEAWGKCNEFTGESTLAVANYVHSLVKMSQHVFSEIVPEGWKEIVEDSFNA